MVKVDVTGLDALRSSFDGVREKIEAELASAVQAEADAVVQDARMHVRVDSGDLRDMITAEVDGLDASVAPRPELSSDGERQAAIKANVNEFGRSNDPGQPYMVPASEASRQRWPKRASDAVKRGARG